MPHHSGAELPGAQALRQMAAQSDSRALFSDRQPDPAYADLFLNRELSWLQFNRRVLAEAADETLPVYERLKFLSIYCSNLDEFYMVRVGSLLDRALLQPWHTEAITGLTPREQLRAIYAETARQQKDFESLWRKVTAALAKQHVEILDFDRLDEADEVLLRRRFDALRPLLSPQVLDAEHPLPFLRNREQYVLVRFAGKRGGAGLIRFVRENTRIPVIETGAGIVHTYFDLDGDLTKGRAVVCNAKTRRVSVCNALDCLIVHRERLRDLAELCDPMAAERVTVYADAEAYAALEGRYPACLLRPAAEEHFGTEFLDYKLAVRTVGSLDEALAHIARYSSRHSEAIVTENAGTAREFTRRVDAACVYVNVSTAFTDGGQFGFGAEVGISTQKLHARGPMGLPELTTYKYVISGNGQTREP